MECAQGGKLTAGFRLPIALRSTFVGLLGLVAWPASAAGADSVISGDRSAANVTAYKGVLAWSREEPGGQPHDGPFRLVVRMNGITRDAPVPPKSGIDEEYVPNLGRANDGAIVAVYERDGDIYELDVVSGSERKVRSISTGRLEFAPSTWAGRFAFAREGFRRGGLFLEWGSIRRLNRSQPESTDLRKKILAYDHEPQPETDQDFPSRIRTHRIRRRSRGRPCRVADANFIEADQFTGDFVSSSVLDGGFVYWIRKRLSNDVLKSLRAERAQPPSKRCRPRNPEIERSNRNFPASTDTIAVDDGAVYYSGQAPRGGVFRADDPVPTFSR